MIRLVMEQAVTGDSGYILVRSKLRAVAKRLNFGAVQAERMELAATEMLTNQNKFGRRTGMFQIWELRGPYPAIDLFAIDYGPGIPDLELARRDGYTTMGTLGRGLGAVERLANFSGVYSIPDDGRDGPWHGVAIWARFHLEPERCTDCAGCQTGMYLRAYHDGPKNGDCLCVDCSGQRLRWLHMDGLGHGPEAAEAVAGQERSLGAHLTPDGTLAAVSKALEGGRGAVGLSGVYDPETAHAELCGVGDMAAWVVTDGARHSIRFSPGILGHAHRHLVREQLSLPANGVLITASDGLRSGWDERTFRGLWHQHPQLVALLLGSVMGRTNDDKSIFTLKAMPGRQKGRVVE